MTAVSDKLRGTFWVWCKFEYCTGVARHKSCVASGTKIFKTVVIHHIACFCPILLHKKTLPLLVFPSPHFPSWFCGPHERRIRPSPCLFRPFLCGCMIPMTARIFCPSLSLSLPSHGSAISFLVHKFWAKRFHFFGGKCEEFGQLGQRTMAALASLCDWGKKTFSAC